MRGLGIDVVEIARFRTGRRAEERLATRVLNARERKHLPTGPRRAQFLAGRFAAKEAVLKTLGTGLAEGVRWHDVEIRADRRGAPSVSLSGATLRRARSLKIRRWLLSISHTRELALAVAIGS